MIPLSLPIFCTCSFSLIVVLSLDDAPLSKKNSSLKILTFLFSILYYFLTGTSRYCTLYEENFYTTLPVQRAVYQKNTNQKKERAFLSDLLVTAHPELVAFSLWLASSSCELINARMTSLASSSPPESIPSLSYSILSLSSVSLLSALAQLSFSVNVLAFLSVDWPALRGLFCYKRMNVLQLPLLYHSCCSSNAGSAHGGLSTCFALEKVEKKLAFPFDMYKQPCFKIVVEQSKSFRIRDQSGPV